MATVDEIVDRLAREDPLYGIYRPGLGVGRTEPKERDSMSWKPNRKIVASLVAGIVALVASFLAVSTGLVLDPVVTAAAVTGLMTLIGYWVPLSDDDVVSAQANNDQTRMN